MANKPCKICQAAGHDSTGDHMWPMQDGKTWCCDRAEYHPTKKILYFDEEGNPTMKVSGDSPGETVTIEESIAFEEPVDIQKYPNNRVYRGIHPTTLEKFGIHTTLTPSGEPDCVYYPMTVDKRLIGYKVKQGKGKTKKIWKTVKTAGVTIDLFNLSNCQHKPEHFIITEGEDDAASASQMLSTKYNVDVTSLPDGVNSLGCLTKNQADIKRATNVYYCGDQDEPGAEIIPKLFKLYPQIRIMKFSLKDANDMLLAKRQAEFIKSFEKAERYKPDSIVCAEDVIGEALTKPEMGLSYPWTALTALTYGIREARLIGVGGAPGGGKSTFFKGIQTHLMYHHEEPIGVFPLEETVPEAMRELAGHIMNLPIDRPDCKYDEKELQKVLDSFKGRLYVYNTDNYEKWLDVEDAIRYMAAEGVKYFFIDPVSALVSHLSPSDANQFLADAFWKMSRMVKSMNITIFHSNHLNNPHTGKDHAEGGKVYGSAFTGSRAIWRFSTDMFGLERDQYAQELVDRNRMSINMIKYRKPTKPGRFDLYYDETTGTLKEEIPKSISGGKGSMF